MEQNRVKIVWHRLQKAMDHINSYRKTKKYIQHHHHQRHRHQIVNQAVVIM